MKIARIVGIVSVVLGLAYWVASFFFPSSYSNEKPDSDIVYSTKVVSRDEVEKSTPPPSETFASPSSFAPKVDNADQTVDGKRSISDPMSDRDARQAPIPEGIQPSGN